MNRAAAIALALGLAIGCDGPELSGAPDVDGGLGAADAGGSDGSLDALTADASRYPDVASLCAAICAREATLACPVSTPAECPDLCAREAARVCGPYFQAFQACALENGDSYTCVEGRPVLNPGICQQESIAYYQCAIADLDAGAMPGQPES